MSAITTHILDVSRGKPARGVAVVLESSGAQDGWQVLGRGVTDEDGRLRNLLKDDFHLTPGAYRLVFQTGDYFAAKGVETFYTEVMISFNVRDAEEHYHVPLLLSPFGYSTYRGS